jgi:hypothetical protein
MARRQGSTFTRSGLAAALLALGLAGCNGNYAVQVSSPGAPPMPPPSAGLSISTSGSGGLLAGFFGLGMLAVASGVTAYFPAPPMDPARRIVEQDCTRPIEDPAANLRCR